MDINIRGSREKESGTETTTIHEESDYWNQCVNWSVHDGTEWIGGAGESGDNARRVEWRKW